MFTIRQRRNSRAIFKPFPLALFLLTLLLAPAAVRAQKSDEFDEYKIPFDAGWFYSYPSGTIRAPGRYLSGRPNQGAKLNSYFHVCRQSGLEIRPQKPFLCGHCPAVDVSHNDAQPRHRLGGKSDQRRCCRSERASCF